MLSNRLWRRIESWQLASELGFFLRLSSPARLNEIQERFSATIPPQIESLIGWAMKRPEIVEIGQRRSPAETVQHALDPVAEVQKADLLKELCSRATNTL